MKGKFSWIIFLFPALVLLIIFRFVPLVNLIRYSLFAWNITGPVKFVGFKNFINIFKDPFFWNAFLNTLWYVVFTVPLSVAISLIVAVLLNQIKFLRNFFRTIYFLPVITSLVAISVVWKWFYDPTRGLLNYLLSFLGLKLLWLEEPRGIFEILFGKDLPQILEGPSLALFSLSIMSVWKNLGYNVLIFLAGLQNISKVYYEAAKIDGANSFKIFLKITLPLLSPTTFYVLIMTTIASFQVFAPVWIMTGPPPGGPLGKTSVLVYYLYQKGFEEYQVGYGSAIAFVVFVILLILTILQKKILEKRVYYEV